MNINRREKALVEMLQKTIDEVDFWRKVVKDYQRLIEKYIDEEDEEDDE